jgi:hypothetical protein
MKFKASNRHPSFNMLKTKTVANSVEMSMGVKPGSRAGTALVEPGKETEPRPARRTRSEAG